MAGPGAVGQIQAILGGRGSEQLIEKSHRMPKAVSCAASSANYLVPVLLLLLLQ